MNIILAYLTQEQFAKDWNFFWSIVAVVFGIVWAFLPFLLLSSLNRIRKEVAALRADAAAQVTLSAALQRRTNELLEWLGTVAQQEKGLT